MRDRLLALLRGTSIGVRPPIHARGRSRLTLALVAMASFSLACGATFGKRGFFSVVRAKRDRARLVADMAALEAECRLLEEEIAALERDPRASERLAREELSLGRPGEVLVLLPSEAPRDPRRQPGWISPLTPLPLSPENASQAGSSP